MPSMSKSKGISFLRVGIWHNVIICGSKAPGFTPGRGQFEGDKKRCAKRLRKPHCDDNDDVHVQDFVYVLCDSVAALKKRKTTAFSVSVWFVPKISQNSVRLAPFCSSRTDHKLCRNHRRRKILRILWPPSCVWVPQSSQKLGSCRGSVIRPIDRVRFVSWTLSWRFSSKIQVWFRLFFTNHFSSICYRFCFWKR